MQAQINPSGLCQCGCGNSAPLAKRTRRDMGHVRGEPVRFIPSHVFKAPNIRAVIAEAQRGRKMPPQTRAAIFASRKGAKASPETRAKIAAAKRGKPNSPEHRAALSRAWTPERRQAHAESMMGEAHPLWTGEQATYRAAHKRMLRRKPKTGMCEECGREAPITQWAFEGPNGGYSTDPDDYRELCVSCHLRQDRSPERRKKDAKARGYAEGGEEHEGQQQLLPL